MKHWYCCLALVSVVACKSHSGEPAPKPAPAAPSAVASVRTPPKPVSLASIPTPEDFEEEAEQQITPQNLEGELDKLEQELKAP